MGWREDSRVARAARRGRDGVYPGEVGVSGIWRSFRTRAQRAVPEPANRSHSLQELVSSDDPALLGEVLPGIAERNRVGFGGRRSAEISAGCPARAEHRSEVAGRSSDPGWGSSVGKLSAKTKKLESDEARGLCSQKERGSRRGRSNDRPNPGRAQNG